MCVNKSSGAALPYLMVSDVDVLRVVHLSICQQKAAGSNTEGPYIHTYIYLMYHIIKTERNPKDKIRAGMK